MVFALHIDNHHVYVAAFAGATITTSGQAAVQDVCPAPPMEALCKCLFCRCMWACMMMVQCTNLLQLLLAAYCRQRGPMGMVALGYVLVVAGKKEI